MNYKVIDLTYLDEVSTSFVFIKKMIDLFRTNLSEFERDMKLALGNDDFSSLSELAHKAKSSVMIFGMEKQAGDMKSLEFDIKCLKNKDTYENRVNNFLASCKEALIDIEKLEQGME